MACWSRIVGDCGRRDGLTVRPYDNRGGLAALRCGKRRLAQQEVVSRPRRHPSLGQEALQRSLPAAGNP